MSRINKTIKWVDLHPRAERLLEDAGVGTCTQSNADPALTAAQHAFVCGAYMAADLLMGQSPVSSQDLPAANTPPSGTDVVPTHNPRAIKRGEYVVLPKSTLDSINRWTEALRDVQRSNKRASMAGACISSLIRDDGMDFFDVCAMWDEGGIMPSWVEFDAQFEADDQADIKAADAKAKPVRPGAYDPELERLARNWAARDRRAGKPKMPMWQRVNELKRDAERERAFDQIAALGEKSRKQSGRGGSK